MVGIGGVMIHNVLLQEIGMLSNRNRLSSSRTADRTFGVSCTFQAAGRSPSTPDLYLAVLKSLRAIIAMPLRPIPGSGTFTLSQETSASFASAGSRRAT